MNGIATGCYEIDLEDRLTDVDEAWLDFAARNGAADLLRATVLNQSIYYFIAGRAAEALYARLYESLRERPRTISLPFRCDAPDLKRFMELKIRPEAHGHIRSEGRLLRCEERRRIPLLDPKVKHNGQWLIICSLCRRLGMDGGHWREIEDALTDPYDEPASGLPQLSHDVCPDCMAMLRRASDCP